MKTPIIVSYKNKWIKKFASLIISNNGDFFVGGFLGVTIQLESNSYVIPVALSGLDDPRLHENLLFQTTCQ